MRALFILFLIAGCASVPQNQAKIEFRSNPEGAVISTQAKNFGQAPASVYWTLSGPTAESEPVTATWPSGATATARIKLEAGKEFWYTFQRPVNAPGAAIDLNHAAQIENIRQLRQMQAINSGQMLQNNLNWQNQVIMNDLNRQPQVKTPTRQADPSAYNCQPNVLGNQYNCTPRPW